jgi:hypothetical protein
VFGWEYIKEFLRARHCPRSNDAVEFGLHGWPLSLAEFGRACVIVEEGDCF